MPYSEMMIKPMRDDLTRIGFEETRTPEAVDTAIKNSTGTVLVVVNSVCGCDQTVFSNRSAVYLHRARPMGRRCASIPTAPGRR